MTDNLPLAISKKQCSPGYVYFIRYHHSKNCYKIGSSGNVLQRILVLGGGIYRGVELIAYGYSYHRFDTEWWLQQLLIDKSNNAWLNNAMRKIPRKINYQFEGSANSLEYFILSPHEAKQVISMMKVVCASVQVGPRFPPFEHKPFYPSISKEEDPCYFYDEVNHRFIKYPTQFTDEGWPIYEPIDNYEGRLTV
jgi:hypothetical protein